MLESLWWRIKALARAEELSLSVFGVVIGSVAGVGVALAHNTVQWLHEVLFGLDRGAYLSASQSLDPVRVFVALIAGGLVVGLYTWGVRRWRKREAVDPIEANALYGGRMSVTDSVLLTGGTVLSSGCGAAVGMEAGYTQFGAGVASWLGRQFNLRRADLRTLVACGAAAGIAAAFDAPMAGAFYAFELVLGAYAVVTLAPVMLAALTAPAVAGLITDDLSSPLLNIDLYFSPYDIGVFVGIGVIAGFAGIGIMKMATTGEVMLRKVRLPEYLRPALGGLGVAVLALYSPAVLGAGHGAMQYYLVHAHGFMVLLGLFIAKVLAAALSVGTGFRGGLFHTSLFVGILLGDVVGLGIMGLFPQLPVDRIVYALVGMASVAAAIIGAPITMIFLVFEQTGNIAIASGVMIGAVIASLLVRRVFGYSFATWRFHIRGEAIRSAFDISWVRDLTVVKLMRREARTAGEHMTVAAFRKRFPIGSTERVFLVDDGGGYAGFVITAEVHSIGNDGTAETMPVRDLRHAPDVFLLPRQNINQILQAFERAETEVLAVVDDPQCRVVLGYVTEAYALRRYALELDKRRRELSGER
ncbi:chloride channel protein [Pseudochelatococcus sp. B33]